MSRVTTSPNSIVGAVVNSDEYHQSPLMDKWEGALIYVIIIIGRSVFQYVNV